MCTNRRVPYQATCLKRQSSCGFLHMDMGFYIANSQSISPARSPECPSRLPEQVIQLGSQMVSPAGYSKINFSSRGCFYSRFVCNSPELKVFLILFKYRSQSQVHLRCFPLPTGQGSAVHVDTSASNPHGYCQAKARTRQNYPHCSRLAKDIVVLQSTQAFKNLLLIKKSDILESWAGVAPESSVAVAHGLLPQQLNPEEVHCSVAV